MAIQGGVALTKGTRAVYVIKVKPLAGRAERDKGNKTEITRRNEAATKRKALLFIPESLAAATVSLMIKPLENFIKLHVFIDLCQELKGGKTLHSGFR